MTNNQSQISELESIEYQCGREKSTGQDSFRAAVAILLRGAIPAAVAGAEHESAGAGAVAAVLDAVPRVRRDVDVEHLAVKAA